MLAMHELRSCQKDADGFLNSCCTQPRSGPNSRMPPGGQTLVVVGHIWPNYGEHRPSLVGFGPLLWTRNKCSKTCPALVGQRLDKLGARRDCQGQLFGTCGEQLLGNFRVALLLSAATRPCKVATSQPHTGHSFHLEPPSSCKGTAERQYSPSCAECRRHLCEMQFGSITPCTAERFEGKVYEEACPRQVHEFRGMSRPNGQLMSATERDGSSISEAQRRHSS